MGMDKTNVVVFGGAIEVTDKGEEFPIPQRWEHEVKKESVSLIRKPGLGGREVRI